MMKKLWLLILMLLVLPVTATYAVKVSSIYQADMSVSSKSEQEKEQAVQQGLALVLSKITGDPNIVNNEVIKAELNKAEYYVQELYYSAPTASSSTYTIHVRYEKYDLDRLIKKTGVTALGEARPLTLVWLAVSKGDEPAEIIGNEMPGDLLDLMKQKGKQVGLPMIFPMMDVEDISHVSPEDVMSLSKDKLKDASKRYLPDAVLIGDIKQNDDLIESDWQLNLGDQQWKWTISGKTQDEVFKSLMMQLSQTYTKHYKAPSNPEKSDKATSDIWLKLKVSKVSQPSDLKKLMDFLKQLSQVEEVTLSQVSGDVVNVAVRIHGSVDSFQKNAEMMQHLALKSQDQTSNQLEYDFIH